MNMSIKKDRVMQELQRFGGAMYTPVILFAFFGLTVAISIVCKNTMLLGSIADKGTVWYDFWFVVEQGAWTVFAQMPILFAIAVPERMTQQVATELLARPSVVLGAGRQQEQRRVDR